MNLFKNAKQIIIPDEMLDTESWLSDEDLMRLAFSDATSKINEQLVNSVVDTDTAEHFYAIHEPMEKSQSIHSLRILEDAA